MSIMATYAFDLFTQLMDRLDDEELAEFVFIARRIWLSRNSFIFGGVISSPWQIVKLSLTSLQNFRDAELESGSMVTELPQPVKTSWTKPIAGMLKANWDAALDF